MNYFDIFYDLYGLKYNVGQSDRIKPTLTVPGLIHLRRHLRVEKLCH